MLRKMIMCLMAFVLIITSIPAAMAQGEAVGTEMPPPQGASFLTGKGPLQVETPLFTAALAGEGWAEIEGVGWRIDREDYSTVRYDLKDKSGINVASFSLTARSEKADKYYGKLKSLREYASQAGKDDLDSLTIGGIGFKGIEYERWGGTIAEYAARVPESSFTLMIKIKNPEAVGEGLKAILGSIAFTLPTLTPPNVDPPAPEDGMPYRPAPAARNLGDRQITAGWVKTDRPIMAKSLYNNHIALKDGHLYALAGRTLYAYTLSGDTLTPDPFFAGGQMALDDEYNFRTYEYLSPGRDGALFVSEGAEFVLRIKDGAVLNVTEHRGYLVMHPSGEWGIRYRMSMDPEWVITGDEFLRDEPWVLSNLSDDAARQGRFSSISFVAITEKRIYIAGTDAEMGGALRVAAFDLDGKELFTFGAQDPKAQDALGSVTGIAETPGGILVLDGGYQAMKLFDMQGEYLASLGSDSLLGTENAWLSSVVMDGDDALIAATQARKDGSANELLIFRVKGL